MELFGNFPLAKFSWDSGRLDNLDAMMANPVTRSHFGVHLLYSTIQSGISVLFVHVMITSPTLVTQPDTIVLDCGWVLLKDLLTKS